MLSVEILLGLNISNSVFLRHVLSLFNSCEHTVHTIIWLLGSSRLLLGHNLASRSFAWGRGLHFFVVSAFVIFQISVKTKLMLIRSRLFLLSLPLSCLWEGLITTLVVLIINHISQSTLICAGAGQRHTHTSSSRKHCLSVKHQLVWSSMVSLLLLFEWNCQSIQSLFIVNRCFEIQQSLQEQDLTCRWNFVGIRWGCVMTLNATLPVAWSVVLRLAEKATDACFTVNVGSNHRIVPAVGFSAFDKSWQLLPVDNRAFLAKPSLGASHLIPFRLEGPNRRSFNTWDLRLFDSINEFLDRLFQKVNLSHLTLLIFLNSSLNRVQSSLIKLLRLDEHLNPLLLLPLKILDDCLMVDQMLFILWEVLGTDILDLFEFLVVLLVDSIVVLVDVPGSFFNEFLQFLDIVFLRLWDGLSKRVNFLLHSLSCIWNLGLVYFPILLNHFFQFIDLHWEILVQFRNVVLRALKILFNCSVKPFNFVLRFLNFWPDLVLKSLLVRSDVLRVLPDVLVQSNLNNLMSLNGLIEFFEEHVVLRV